MPVPCARVKALTLLLGVASLAGLPLPAGAQTVIASYPSRQNCPPTPCLPAPGLPAAGSPGAGSAAPGVIPELGMPRQPNAGTGADAAAGAGVGADAFRTPSERSLAEASYAYVPPNTLGDFLNPSGGTRTVIFAPRGVTPTARTVRIPSATHNFKISDNGNPLPQDRVLFGYNYYNDIASGNNQGFGRTDVHRETFGLEKTFLDGNASVGFRLPLNTLAIPSGNVPGLGGTFTDVGDLTVILKGVILQDRQAGNILSAGVAVTAPTGPRSFAGAGNDLLGFSAPHSTVFQPFTGIHLNLGAFYLQGFTAADIPTDSSDVTLLFNDFGVGYFLYRDRDAGRLVTAVAPTVELHLNTPLNHRGSQNFPIGASDSLNLTGGVNIELRGRSTLGIGVVTPLTGPKPFDVEAIVQLNVRF
jgi:hypothetical protein